MWLSILATSFDLCLNICIQLYLPSPKIHIQGHFRWFYFVLILHWHDMVQWDVLHHVREGTVQLSSTTENLIHTWCNVLNCTGTSSPLNSYVHNVLVHIFIKATALPTCVIYASLHRFKLACCCFVHLENVYTALFHTTTFNGDHVYSINYHKNVLYCRYDLFTVFTFSL